jgi:small-conductance mechanosensitive channel
MDPLLRSLPPPMQDAFAVELAGNTLLAWAVAVLVFVTAFAFLLAVRFVVGRRLQRFAERTATRVDDVLADAVAHTWRLVMAVVALYLAAGVLDLPTGVAVVVRRAFAIAVFAQVGIWVSRTIAFLIGRHVQEQREAGQATRAALLALFSFFAQLALWAVVFLLALDNLGVDVTAMVAGLGIGGIAIGLALQNVLKDTFASLAIILDKPFVEGDVIAVGDLTGTVERIGLKTTRVRSVDGEQIVFGNDDLLSSRLRNFARLRERRVLLVFGLAYQTPPDAIERIPAWIREIVEAQAKARFERAHFKGFGASSLDFEAVYHVLVPDYPVAMDVQQAVNLALMRRLAAARIEFAYPTPHVVVEGALAGTRRRALEAEPDPAAGLPTAKRES